MGKTNWLELLDWDEEQIEDLRHAGYSYIRQGKYEIAISFFGALVILEPDSAYNAQTLGALHLQVGNAEQAIRYLDRALKLEGDHSPTLLNMVKAQFLLGKNDEALQLARILARDSNSAVSNVAKALLLAYS